MNIFKLYFILLKIKYSCSFIKYYRFIIFVDFLLNFGIIFFLNYSWSFLVDWFIGYFFCVWIRVKG